METLGQRQHQALKISKSNNGRQGPLGGPTFPRKFLVPNMSGFGILTINLATNINPCPGLMTILKPPFHRQHRPFQYPQNHRFRRTCSALIIILLVLVPSEDWEAEKKKLVQNSRRNGSHREQGTTPLARRRRGRIKLREFVSLTRYRFARCLSYWGCILAAKKVWR